MCRERSSVGLFLGVRRVVRLDFRRLLSRNLGLDRLLWAEFLVGLALSWVVSEGLLRIRRRWRELVDLSLDR